MVTNLDSHTDGDYDLPPRTGVLKKYKNSSNVSAKARRLQEQTRLLEVEAYKAVLRAFGAQSDGISWARFELMSDLRKELRVTDDQHKELLDVTVRQIRDQMARTLKPQHVDPAPAPAPAPTPTRKRKTPEKIDEAAPPPPPPQQQQPPQKPGGPAPKKFFTRKKKAPPPPDLSTLDALQNEVDRLESEPDVSRLVHAKSAAYELKRKILDALDQCGADDEDSEKTAEVRRDENQVVEEVANEAQASEDDEKDEEGEDKDVKTGMDIEG